MWTAPEAGIDFDIERSDRRPCPDGAGGTILLRFEHLHEAFEAGARTGDGTLQQAKKNKLSAAAVSAVETERELVEISPEVLLGPLALVGIHERAIEQRECSR